MERILSIMGTIKRLEDKLREEIDPRERQDIFETLALLESSLRYEVDKFSQEFLKDKKAS